MTVDAANNTQGANYVGAAELPPNTGALTMNFVLEFARARKDQVDGWLNKQLGSMKQAGASIAALNELIATLGKYSQGFDHKDYMDQVKAAFEVCINKLPFGPLRDKLIRIKDWNDSALNKSGDPNVPRDDKVLPLEMQSIIDGLKGDLNTIDHEQQEIQLMVNQKMGEKSEILQLAAMLIQQTHETTKAILQRS
jgi:hypothetical protein